MNTIPRALGPALALAGTLVAGRLSAQQPAHQDMGQMAGMTGMEEHMAAMASINAYVPAALLEKEVELALTTDQVAKLGTLASDVRQAKAKAQADHDAHHAQLAKVFEAAAPNATQVKEHARLAMAAMAEGHGAELAVAAKAKGLLTAEQRAKVDAAAGHMEHGQH
ncbi:MAG: hypothetical protein EXR93_09415 [Gemmatimonadetes bacterium]|nr:hypothetical protein [Gemmatimonadota bacterium]